MFGIRVNNTKKSLTLKNIGTFLELKEETRASLDVSYDEEKAGSNGRGSINQTLIANDVAVGLLEHLGRAAASLTVGDILQIF